MDVLSSPSPHARRQHLRRSLLSFPTETPSPSPVPATDTPTPTFTPEPTSTPFPKYFTTEFDSLSLTGWVILQAGNDAVPDVTVQENKLHVQTNSPYSWVYTLYQPEDYDNVRIDTKFVNNAMSPGLRRPESAATAIRTAGSKPTSHPTGRIACYMVNGSPAALPTIFPSQTAPSQAIQQSGTEMQIGVICSGTTLTLSIGDTIIRNVDVSRYELASGKVGLAASSYENTPVIVSFDWFKVSEP